MKFELIQVDSYWLSGIFDHFLIPRSTKNGTEFHGVMDNLKKFDGLNRNLLYQMQKLIQSTEINHN